jgi:hypothetical protein
MVLRYRRFHTKLSVRGRIQKFPDWPPGTRIANGKDLCHQVQLCRYFVSQSSEFCRHNPLFCFSTSNTKGKRIFRYRLNPETFGYTVVSYLLRMRQSHERKCKIIISYRPVSISFIFLNKMRYRLILRLLNYAV